MIATTKTLIVDGETVEIKRLSLPDLISIGDGLQTEKETIARQLAKDEKLEKFELLNLLIEVRRQKVTINEILASTATPQGAINIIKKSMAKSQVKPDVQTKVLDSNVPDLMELAKMLVLDVHEDVPTDAPVVEEPLSPLPLSPSISEQSGPNPIEAEKVAADCAQAVKIAEALRGVATLGGKK